jgi:hypothetical protein
VSAFGTGVKSRLDESSRPDTRNQFAVSAVHWIASLDAKLAGDVNGPAKAALVWSISRSEDTAPRQPPPA